MNLIIQSIAMVDITNKEARKISFDPHKNLLTSTHNHLGKSVVMKSIYHTLGAEVYYPRPIKRLNFLTYIDFLLEGHVYRVARLQNSFILYCDYVFAGKYSSVSEFGDKLIQLFELEINLVSKDADGTIVKCPPAFYYMPYYIDQENGWAANSYSFNNLTQFDLPQRKNSYFFHLGALDGDYVKDSKAEKANSRTIKKLQAENSKYQSVIETLQIGVDATQTAFDIDSLDRAMSIRQSEITRLLKKIERVRNNLVQKEDKLLQLQHEKDVLSKYIKKHKPLKEDIASEIIVCPRCGMVFEHSLEHRLEKAYLLESLNDDYSKLVAQHTKLEHTIIRLRTSFDDYRRELSSYEKGLNTDREIYNSYVKSKATSQLLEEYHEQIEKNTERIKYLAAQNSGYKDQMRKYDSSKQNVKTSYSTNLDYLLRYLDVPKDQLSNDIEPGSSPVVSGAYGPRCKIAQMLAFIETQNATAPQTITFPLVIDSPNTLEQDNDHLDSVIQMLFTWDKTDNQIIVASIQGKETAATLPDVNIITLTNPQNHLLSYNEYSDLEAEISEIITRF